jgi:hypothetical protein
VKIDSQHMRSSKLCSRILMQIVIKFLEFLGYRYGLLINKNLLLVVVPVLSEFELIWSKITPKLTQIPNRAQNRTVETVTSKLPGSDRSKMDPERNFCPNLILVWFGPIWKSKHSWEPFLIRFDLFIKPF